MSCLMFNLGGLQYVYCDLFILITSVLCWSRCIINNLWCVDRTDERLGDIRLKRRKSHLSKRNAEAWSLCKGWWEWYWWFVCLAIYVPGCSPAHFVSQLLRWVCLPLLASGYRHGRTCRISASKRRLKYGWGGAVISSLWAQISLNS